MFWMHPAHLRDSAIRLSLCWQVHLLLQMHLQKQVLFQMSRKGSYSSKMENPDFASMAIFVIAIIVLSTFMPGPAMLAIIIVMARNLSDAGEANAARIIFPAAALTTLWNGRIPFGIGAGNFAILNGFLEPYGDQYVVGMFDPMKAGLIPGILPRTVYDFLL